MKKLVKFLVLPIIAIGLILTGCGKGKSTDSIKQNYESMIENFQDGESNIFFSDSTRPNSIVIAYNGSINSAINTASPSTDIIRRYKALGYQQKVLDNIFYYYENNYEEFYRVASSKDIPADKMNSLYDKISNLYSALRNFKTFYNNLIDSVDHDGLQDVMEFTITSYSFELNKVIDCSFDFIYKFEDIFTSYCLEGVEEYTPKGINLNIAKSNIDIANIVYLENIKSFNYKVGDKGICDLSPMISNSSEYKLLNYLNDPKSASYSITENLGASALDGGVAMSKVNAYLYAKDVFEQRLTAYRNVYKKLDIYLINQYKLELVTGSTYESYINSLSASQKASTSMLKNFIDDYFNDYIEKFNGVTE